MILGIGVDLLEIDRITTVYERHGARFKNRILTAAEKIECDGRASTVNYLAKQFAAKESVSKALGVGIGKLGFRDIEIIRDASGKPNVRLLNDAVERFGTIKIHLSLSDTKESVSAFCVIEQT